ncbi:MAG: hypothetical protein JXA57_04445 [Armatimonadetes bacterium]|nr:hypothetical protein [Armatimonadota bacterium]
MDGTVLERAAWRDFGEGYLRAITECVFLAHQQGWKECGQIFADPEAENLRPFYIRAKLEGFLRAAAERYGVGAQPLKQPRQPWNHTEVVAGRTILTAATVPSPGAMVDPSDYRKGLACTSQRSLPLVDSSAPNRDGHIYVILTHSRYRGTTSEDTVQNGHLPGSVYLAWPASDFKCYVHQSNLIEKFPDVARKYVPRDWQEEAIVRYLARMAKSAFE